MTQDNRPTAQTLRELLLEMRGGFVLHRPILVDVTPTNSDQPESTIERTLSMELPAAGESQLASELAGCRFLVLGPNRLAATSTVPLAIGRSRRCDLRIDNESVSKVHSSLTFDLERGCLVVDEHSRNGTRIAGVPVAPGQPTPLYAGAQVAFGDALFVFLDPATLRKLARLAS